MLQLSPNFGSVFMAACANADWFKWHAVQADVVAGAVVMRPCGSVTLFRPTGRLDSEPLTWQRAQLVVSCGVPVVLMAGKRTPVLVTVLGTVAKVAPKLLWLPP